MPEKCYRMCRRKEDLDELPEDTTDVFQRIMLDRCTDRPDSSFQNGKFAAIDLICFAEFLSCYHVQSKSKPEL